jgi:hypothetical protein
MRILTFRRIFGLTAIGVAYVHGRRGGTATVASITDTLRYLWTKAADRVAGHPHRSVASRPIPRVGAPNGMQERTPRPPQGS